MNTEFEEMTSIYQQASMPDKEREALNKATGHALTAPLDRFREDPENARKSFDQEDLILLGESILAHGVIEPISVIKDADNEGCFVVAGGNRRLRASILAGVKTIPYVLRDTTDSLERIILNQHSRLGVIELSDALNKERAAGVKTKDIAKALGKSYQWVTKYLSAATFPEAIIGLVNSGTTDMNFLCTLAANYKHSPEEVDDYINGGVINRAGWQEWLACHPLGGSGEAGEAGEAGDKRQHISENLAESIEAEEADLDSIEAEEAEVEAGEAVRPHREKTTRKDELPTVPDLEAGMIFIAGKLAVEFKRVDRVEMVIGDRRWDIEIGE